MRASKFTRSWKYLESSTLIFALASAIGAVVSPIAASAQDKKDEISSDLVPNPQFVDCPHKSPYEEPKARATVGRGKLSDILILDVDGFEPGLPFDLFTAQRSPFLPDKTPIRTSRTSSKAAFASCSTYRRLRSGHVNGRTQGGTFAMISVPDQTT